MLSRGLRIVFGVGILLVVLALGQHFVLRYYNAPADTEYDLLNVFVATFASTILTFFIGALLFDYQLERRTPESWPSSVRATACRRGAGWAPRW